VLVSVRSARLVALDCGIVSATDHSLIIRVHHVVYSISLIQFIK
jgi:hypothetical protein